MNSKFIKTYLHKYFTLGLLVILLLAIGVRIYRLDYNNFWRDEAFSVNLAQEDFSEILSVTSNDTQSPLHLLIMHYVGMPFTYNEIAMRMVSVIFGLLTLFAIYKIARLFFSKEFSLAVLAFGALNPILVYYSQEARPYSLMTFAFAASLYFFLKLYSNSSRNFVDYFGFAIFNLIGLYSQNLYIVPFGIFNLLVLWKIIQRNRLSKISTTSSTLSQLLKLKSFQLYSIFNILVSAFYFPWLLVVFKQLQNFNSEGFWLVFKPISNIPDLILHFSIGHEYNSILNWQNGFIIIILIFFNYLFFFFGVIKFLKLKKSRIMFYIFLVNIGLVALISIKSSFFYIRYLSFLAVIWVFVQAIGLSTIKSITIKTLCLAVLLIFHVLFFMFNVSNRHHKPQYDALIRHIQFDPDYGIGETVISENALPVHGVNYYSRGFVPIYIYKAKEDLPFYQGLASLSDFIFGQDFRLDGSEIWLVSEDTPSNELKNELKNRGYFAVEREFFSGVILEKWERSISK